MTKTYAPPTVTTRGDVVRNTLGSKIVGAPESPTRKLSGGSNLSFGL